MSEVGRPTELNDVFCLKIRQWVLEGKTLKEIAELSEIPYDTMQGWVSRNYEGFADRMHTYKLERRLAKAEANIDEILDMDVTNKEVVKIGFGEDVEYEMKEFKDPKLIKIKADISTFVSETVGKKDYSKRTELTGDKGGPIKTTTVTDEEFAKIVQNYGTNNAAKSPSIEANIQ